MPVVGKVMKFLKTKTGFLVCILIPMAIFFLFELFKLIMVIMQMKQQPAKLTESDEEEIKKRAIEEYLAEQNKLKEQSGQSEEPQPQPDEQDSQTTATDDTSEQ